MWVHFNKKNIEGINSISKVKVLLKSAALILLLLCVFVLLKLTEYLLSACADGSHSHRTSSDISAYLCRCDKTDLIFDKNQKLAAVPPLQHNLWYFFNSKL